jgi:hypothetical protein
MCGAVAIAAAPAAPALAASVTFDDFSSTAGLTLNGTAATRITSDGSVMRVTRATNGQSGSFFSTTPLNAATFSAYFRFRITGSGGGLGDGNTDPGADGLVFVVQNISSNIGGVGGGIGYSGIGSSVGIEFDTWHNGGFNDPDSNHLGIDLNGNVTHPLDGSGNPMFVQPIATRFDNGSIWYGWIDYDGTTMEVRTNQTGVRPTLANLTRVLDLTSILGGATAYVGITSATGDTWSNHDVLSLQYDDTYHPIGDPIPPVPLPAAAPLGLAFLPVMLLIAHVKKRRAVI